MSVSWYYISGIDKTFLTVSTSVAIYALNFKVFPLHELPALEELQKTWVRAFFNPQPLDDVCKYFGVKISMYFAWLGHYTTALIIPAAVGVIFWVNIC